jgi:SAM-dependent methyltransferase
MRFEQLRQLLTYHARWASRFAAHDVHCVFGRAMHDLRAYGFGELGGKRVLDLGCGPMYAFALQCAARGATVTALDVKYVRPGPLPTMLLRALAHDGFGAAVRLGVRRAFFASGYYRRLEAEAHTALRSLEPEVEFVTCDTAGGGYPLPSSSFDLVVANAVLEHVGDVASTAKEIRRILRPGGYFYAIIHNFYSPSGGHCPEWAYPDVRPSPRVPPWDHLRGCRFPPTCFLNRMRPEEYREALSRYLDVVLFEGRGIDHEPGRLEGERLLTERVAAELADYPRELLLTRCWCALCISSSAK